MTKLPDFYKTKALIVGDILLDRYLIGPIHRISPEAPVPVVAIDQVYETPGGAANTALNMRKLGADVTLIGIVGRDKEASILTDLLKNEGIKTHFIETSEPTIQKTRVVSSRQQILRLDTEKMYSHQPHELISAFKKHLPQANIVILSDYAKGTLSHSKELIQLAKTYNIPVLVDPKSKEFNRYEGATIITPNTREFEDIVGPCANEVEIIEKGEQLLHQHHFEALLITRGIHGMMLLSKYNPPYQLKAIAQEISNVTGAGDTVMATLAASLGAGVDLLTAVKLSNIAASISVRKEGTSTVSLHELQRELQQNHSSLAYNILSETDLLAAIHDAKERGEQIVMTNGCFDLLHAGHVTYLEEARSLGERLIVAINDDASVAKLKGEARPIHSLEHRIKILSSLRAVDWVIPFSEDTPEQLIRKIKPNVLVKGEDYTIDQIAGAEFVSSYGGKVKVLPFLEGCSTSQTIKKIKETAVISEEI